MSYSRVSFAKKTILVLVLLGALVAVVLMAPCTQKVTYTKLLHRSSYLQYDSVPGECDFSFKNISSEPVSLWFSIPNQIDFSDSLSMIRAILGNAVSEEEKALAIWKFVSGYGYHYPYSYNHNLPDHVQPFSLVSFPYFLCGEKAGIISAISQMAGIESRLVILNGHVVSELKYQGKWHLFDGDEGCIFRNIEGQIASASELYQNTGWISKRYIELYISDDYSGDNSYKKYFSKPIMFDTISVGFGIFDTPSIHLFPQDEVHFYLTPTPTYQQWLHPRRVLKTSGILNRKLRPSNSNVLDAGSSKTLFTEAFPFYLKKLVVKATSGVNTNVVLVCSDRITGSPIKFELGRLKNGSPVTLSLNAPADPVLYYAYHLEFDSLAVEDWEKVIIEHHFEFNHATFPLNRSGTKAIRTFSKDTDAVLFTINKAASYNEQ